MSERPSWLPEIVNTDGEWEEVHERLYKVFSDDFIKKKPKLNGLPVWWDRRVLPDDCYEEGFWHLITRRDNKTNERLFDPRRAERLTWCGALIENFNDEKVKFWDYKEANGRIRTYLWLEELDYAIILEKKRMRIGEVYFLVTAFYVDGESKRRSLRKKYENRMP